MIGTSFPEWISIRISILILRYTPLLYAATIVFIFLTYGSLALSFLITRILSALLLADGLFFFFIYRPFTKRLKLDAQHPNPLSPAQRRVLFHKSMEKIQSADSYLQGWFLGAPREEICRENVKDFLLWGFFDRDSIITDEEDISQELDEYLEILESKLSTPLPNGRGNAQSLRLTLDEVKSTYRSLVWYIIIFFVDQLTHLALRWHGFQYYSKSRTNAIQIFPPRPQELACSRYSSSPQLSYWHRPHSNSDTLPIVFFHGIGVGLWTYVRFVADLAKMTKSGKGDVEVIAIEILPISFRLFARIPTKAEFLEQISTILDHHGWQDFAVVSHSYGSVLTTHMLHSPRLQHRIASVALIDPVTITLQLPHVAYNFTRRSPKMANEWMLWYFASTDPGVALCLGRHFFWRENILWKDDLMKCESNEGQKLERRVIVSLSGRDLIVDTAGVSEYLLGNRNGYVEQADDAGHGKLRVMMFPKLDHAQLFDDSAASDAILGLIRLNCEIESSS
ncbi:hypothetical protein BGZ63DRAFT_363265 [Mariannaea sp. PMI_226]|nr:hypothetical protein BGZ63DRAFT_363265 [Mariannaea sp. PMI_226]